MLRIRGEEELEGLPRGGTGALLLDSLSSAYTALERSK